MVFDRKESIKQAIQDNSLDKNTLSLMIDFYVQKSLLTTDDQTELMGLLYPTTTETTMV